MFNDFKEVVIWVDQLRSRLLKIGEDELASSLENALRIGGTSSELLGEIRTELVKLMDTKITKELRIRKEIREIIKMVNSVLGPMPE